MIALRVQHQKCFHLAGKHIAMRATCMAYNLGSLSSRVLFSFVVELNQSLWDSDEHQAWVGTFDTVEFATPSKECDAQHLP